MTGWEGSPRRRRRNQLLVVGLAPSVVATLVAVGLLFTLGHNELGQRATAHGDHRTALGHFAANRWLAVVEPWIAPYNEGVAALREGNHADALADFTVALRTVPSDQECRVLHNIAVTREMAADLVADRGDGTALDLYRRGRDALAQGRCADRTDAPDLVRHQVVATDARLEEKIRALLDRSREEMLAALTPAERELLEDSEADDERAELREQRLAEMPSDPPDADSPVPDEVEYGW